MTDGAAPQTKPALSFWQIWNMCFSFHNQPISALALGGSGLFTLRARTGRHHRGHGRGPGTNFRMTRLTIK